MNEMEKIYMFSSGGMLKGWTRTGGREKCYKLCLFFIVYRIIIKKASPTYSFCFQKQFYPEINAAYIFVSIFIHLKGLCHKFFDYPSIDSVWSPVSCPRAVLNMACTDACLHAGYPTGMHPSLVYIICMQVNMQACTVSTFASKSERHLRLLGVDSILLEGTLSILKEQPV